MGTRHLLLGANGFIGRTVAAKLVEQGSDVVLAGRYGLRPDDVLLRECEFRRFDMTNTAWDALIAGCHVIHHYAWTSIPQEAALDPGGDFEQNVRGTIGLLEAMRRHGGQRLVFASSGGTIYGRARTIPSHEDDRPAPISAYGASKLSAETYINVYNLEHGIDVRIARIANAYGPGQGVVRNFGAIAHFVRSAITGAPIHIWGDGETVRDYVYVADVAEALRLLAVEDLAPLDPRIFNVGSGQGTSLNALLTCIGGRLSLALAPIYEPPRGFDVPYSVLNISRAEQLVGWRPIVSLTEGVGSVIAAMRNEGMR